MCVASATSRARSRRSAEPLASGRDEHRGQVERDAHLGAGDGGAQRGGGQAVAEQQVVGGRGGGGLVRGPGAWTPMPVAEVGDDQRLVERDPALDPVAERLADDGGVLGEAQRGVAGGPAALVLQRLRQVPVEQRGRAGDPALRQGVKQGACSGRGPAWFTGPAPVGKIRGQEIENR